MTASVSHFRTAAKAVLALIGIIGSFDLASAEPINNSGLSQQECYGKDSGCTQFCGRVAGDMRYECFSICDRMLGRCLDTGEWSDSARIDPVTGNPPTKTSQLSGFLLQMMMILGDTDGDGRLSQKEIDAMKQKLLKGADAGDGSKTPAAPDKQ
jgi:hypothetical protein